MTTIETDICVIGAGSGGLSVAAGASQMGAPTTLIEKGLMGGDCLNFGCVPSKALLAAGHAADAVRAAARFGVLADAPRIDAAAVHAHVRDTIESIAPLDSQERYEGLGVRVLRGAARFVGPRAIKVDGTRITARRFVIATGSSPLVPPIPGLDRVPFLTNETIFDMRDLPDHLVIIGGGPIGVELAQAHRHLGAAVTVIEAASLMPREDPELVDFVRRRLIADGVSVIEGATVTGIEATPAGIGVAATRDGEALRVEGSHLLVAAGRRPNTDGLGLEAAGIDHDRQGIAVDSRLRTSNRKVHAIGDVAGGPQFTHVAAYHASIVIKNALLRIPARVDPTAIPRVTYTTPELAWVGADEETAAARLGTSLRVLRWSLADNDRARAEATAAGMVKVLTDRRGRLLGAGIVGPAAGDLIQVWTLAMAKRLGIGALATMVAPYPTLGEASKRAAGSFYAPTLFSARTRRIVRFLARFG